MSQIQIPKGWKSKKLSEICNKITDGAHKTPTYVNDGIPFLRVTDIHEKTINWAETKKIPEEEHLELTKRAKPEFNDVLYSKNGTIGISKVIDWHDEFSIFVSLALLKPKKDVVDPYFLKFYLDSSQAIKQATKRSKNATVTNLHLEEIREIEIPLPPLEIQRQIIQKLDYILGQLEEKKKEIINNTEKNLKAIKFFQKNLDRAISQYYIPLRIPSRWTTKKLSDLADVGQGGTPSTSKPEYWDGEISWLRSGELLDNIITTSKRKITKEGLNNSSTQLCPKGSIMIAMTGQGLTRGRTCFLAIESCANQSCAHIINRSQDILTEFLWAFLKSRYWFIRSIHHGSGQPGINVSILKQLEISFPSLKEQNEILKKLKSEKTIDIWKSKLEDTQKKSELVIQNLNKVTGSILNIAFSGKLVN